MLFIGIDNGASGGIAALEADGSLYRCDPMPATDAELLAVFEALRADLPCFAMLERAHAFPKMGVVGAFTYGRGYGAMQMALHAARIPFDIVQPLKWQTVLSCRTRGDKNVSKRRAQQLFPEHKITHAIADALLIAEYCRRLRVQDHGKEEKQTERQGGQATVTGDEYRPYFEEKNRTGANGAPAVTPRHGAGTRRKAR